MFAELMDRTRAYQAAHAHPGPSQAREPRPSSPVGVVIGVCEGIHQSGRVDERLARVLRAGGDTAQLRALIAEPVIVELVALVDGSAPSCPPSDRSPAPRVPASP